MQSWRKALIPTLVFCLLIVSVTYAVRSTDTTDQFIAAFGVSPDDREVAQIAVGYQLNALARQACETAKQWQVYPGDNFSLETCYWSGIHRLDHDAALAQRHGFSIPACIERFRIQPKWEPGTPYQELRCFDEFD